MTTNTTQDNAQAPLAARAIERYPMRQLADFLEWAADKNGDHDAAGRLPCGIAGLINWGDCLLCARLDEAYEEALVKLAAAAKEIGGAFDLLATGQTPADFARWLDEDYVEGIDSDALDGGYIRRQLETQIAYFFKEWAAMDGNAPLSADGVAAIVESEAAEIAAAQAKEKREAALRAGLNWQQKARYAAGYSKRRGGVIDVVRKHDGNAFYFANADEALAEAKTTARRVYKDNSEAIAYVLDYSDGQGAQGAIVAEALVNNSAEAQKKGGAK